MGPRFNGVEDRKHMPMPSHHMSASMGPRFNGVEDFPVLRNCDAHHNRFNGATL